MKTSEVRRGDTMRRVMGSGYPGALGLIALATAVGFVARSRVNPIDIAMLYLLAVVIAAARYRRPPVLLAGALSVALFDFNFVPPYYTFTVFDHSYFLTFGIMFVVALTMGQLTGRIREQAEESKERERQTAALYALIHELAGAPRAEALDIAARHLGRAGQGDAELCLAERPDWPSTPPFDSVETRMAATWAFEHGQAAGWSAQRDPEGDLLVVPLKTPRRTLGVVVIRPHDASRRLGEATVRTVEALAEQAAIALQRHSTI